jgi:hypothetical protein
MNHPFSSIVLDQVTTPSRFAGGLFRFDWSEQFGPLPTRKDGGERLLGPRHKFWRAVSLWNLQGQRVDGKRAIWHEPKQPVFEKRGQRSFIVEQGEPGWDW